MCTSASEEDPIEASHKPWRDGLRALNLELLARELMDFSFSILKQNESFIYAITGTLEGQFISWGQFGLFWAISDGILDNTRRKMNQEPMDHCCQTSFYFSQLGLTTSHTLAQETSSPSSHLPSAAFFGTKKLTFRVQNN